MDNNSNQQPVNQPVPPIAAAQPPVGFSSSNMDVPPMPVDPLASQNPPTTVPEPTPEPQPATTTPLVVPPPPPPPPPTTVGSTIITGGPKSRFPKKILILGIAGLLIIGILLLVLQVVLPRLKGTTSGDITWWGLWETEQTVAPLIEEYQSAHPGVTIKYVQQSKEQYRERLVNTIAQGNGPDILTIHNSWVPMIKSYLSAIPSSIYTAQEYSQTFYPVITSDMTSGANLVGIPSGYDGLALYVNDNIFSTYGRTVPKTWTELRDTAIALTIKDDKGVIKQSGVALGTTANIDDWQEILALLMFQNGANLKNPTGTLAEGALDFYTIFSREDNVWNNTLPNSTIAFANGTVAMIIAPSWRVHDIKAINPNLKFHLVTVPQLPKNTPDEPDMTYATYWVYGVSNKSKAQAQAWDFLKFLSTKESYEKLYKNASTIRAFGQPYPRLDMRDLVSQDPYVGGIVSLAGNAKSWYLSDKTWDGETGINSRLAKYFEDAINGANNGRNAKSVLDTAASGVTQVLVDYGLATPPPAPKQ